MGLHDEALLPSRDSFYATFLKNHVRSQGLVTTTCLKTVVGVSKDTLPVEYLRSNKPTFCASRISRRSSHCHKFEVNLATVSFVDVVGFRTVRSACVCYDTVRRSN